MKGNLQNDLSVRYSAVNFFGSRFVVYTSTYNTEQLCLHIYKKIDFLKHLFHLCFSK